MKKVIRSISLSVTLIFTLFFTINSKADVFGKDGNMLNLNIGLGTPFVYSGSTLSIPPLTVAYERGITDNIGVGGMIGYYSASTSAAVGSSPFAGLGYTYTWKFTYINIALRGSYHYSLSDKVDVYGGLLLGYSVENTSFSTNDPNTSGSTSYFNSIQPKDGGLILGIYAGARYMFTDHIGVNAELGYSIAFLNVGATFKF